MEKNQITFWDHLDELRARLIKCLYVFFLGFATIYFFAAEKVLNFLKEPLFSQLPKEKQFLYYTGLFENFFVHLRVSAIAALVFLSPVFFFILWGFVAPGLKANEKKKVMPFVAAGSGFFILGSGFAYFVLFPAGVKFFISYGSSSEVAWLTLENYISLVIKILVGFGLAFELPVVLVLLSVIGIVDSKMLEKNRKNALVLVTVISAFAAPPDAVSMLLLMGPLYALYEASIIVVKAISKSPK